MKILTQEQAAKKYPERKYETYDPMILMVGTRREFQTLQIRNTQHISFGGVHLKLESERYTNGTFRVDGTSLDVDRPDGKHSRVVVWINHLKSIPKVLLAGEK